MYLILPRFICGSNVLSASYMKWITRNLPLNWNFKILISLWIIMATVISLLFLAVAPLFLLGPLFLKILMQILKLNFFVLLSGWGPNCVYLIYNTYFPLTDTPELDIGLYCVKHFLFHSKILNILSYYLKSFWPLKNCIRKQTLKNLLMSYKK